MRGNGKNFGCSPQGTALMYKSSKSCQANVGKFFQISLRAVKAADSRGLSERTTPPVAGSDIMRLPDRRATAVPLTSWPCMKLDLLYTTEPILQIAQVIPCTEAEGPGKRFAIWFQGCPLRCPGCCNPEMLPFHGGQPTPVEQLLE